MIFLTVAYLLKRYNVITRLSALILITKVPTFVIAAYQLS